MNTTFRSRPDEDSSDSSSSASLISEDEESESEDSLNSPDNKSKKPSEHPISECNKVKGNSSSSGNSFIVSSEDEASRDVLKTSLPFHLRNSKESTFQVKSPLPPQNSKGMGDEVIILSDEEVPEVIRSSSEGSTFPHPANLTPARQNELISAKKVLELELAKELSLLENLKRTSKKLELRSLPDKGVKMRSSIEKQVDKVNKISNRISSIEKNIVDKSKVEPSLMQPTKVDLHFPKLDDLTKDHTDLRDLGEKALATHQKQQAETVETLKTLHKFLRHSSTEEVSEPSALKVSLLPHQKIGLAWLLKRESSAPPGGILADDMGLGKTLTVISLILKDMEKMHKDEEDEDSYRGTAKGNTLVVVPSSVLGQWASEISSKVKTGSLSVHTHHGPKRETIPKRLAQYDVVLTTFAILKNDNQEGKPGPLLKTYWKRVVLDEAHTIRNHKTKTAKAVFELRAKNRWALTGTPIHNKHEDYFSLLRFLKCKPFDDYFIWKKMVDNKTKSGLDRLHLLTKSLLLRRTKDEIKSSGGLKDLKSKEFHSIQIKLDPEEHSVYQKISHFSSTLLAQYIYERAEKENLLNNGFTFGKDRTKNPFENHPELGRLYNEMMLRKGGVKTHHILVLLLRLRQLCCHPSLVTSLIDSQELGGEVEDGFGNDLGLIDQMMNLSLVPDSDSNEPASRFLKSTDPVFRKDRCSTKIGKVVKLATDILNEGSDKIIIVSQWTTVLDIIKSFLKVKTVSLNGSVPVKDRAGIIEEFNNSQRGARVLLLSLTAGGTGLNLIGANHLVFVDVHWNPQLEAQASDRIYRVGQKKIVHIYKFICVNTIEERIVKLQQDKLEVAQGVLSGSTKIQSSKLTLNDLKQLFNIKI